MIALYDIEKSYGEKRVLTGMTLRLPAGEVTALGGKSGSGKTTLARILLGLEKPDGGRVECPRDIRRAAVFQEDRLVEHMSALDNLRLVGVPADEARAHLEALGLAADGLTRAVRLSGGMRRRVALARALAVNADLIVLDEPMTGLDGEAKRLAATHFLRTRGRAAVLVISHDAEELALLGATRYFSLDGAPESPPSAT